MDVCVIFCPANTSIGSWCFHYAWQEKDVLFSHKILKGSKMNSGGSHWIKKACKAVILKIASVVKQLKCD